MTLISPIIIGLVSFAIYLALLFKAQWPLWQIRRQLLPIPGFKKREFMMKIGLLLKKPGDIFDEADTPDVRALKQEYMREFSKIKVLMPKFLLIPLIGIGLAIVAAIIEAILRGIR
jgi:hypothetical protein